MYLSPAVTQPYAAMLQVVIADSNTLKKWRQLCMGLEDTQHTAVSYADLPH